VEETSNLTSVVVVINSNEQASEPLNDTSDIQIKNSRSCKLEKTSDLLLGV
jgi:hypothetical protein